MIMLFFCRIIDSIIRRFRKMRFKKEINCPHSDFNLVGPVTLINKNIQIGKNVTIYPGCMFWGDGTIKIGNNVSVGNNTIIYASSRGGGVTIGDDTHIAAQCYIIDMDHGTELQSGCISSQANIVSPVVIGSDCWLGANVTVLRGSFIEDGAVVGAKGLVKESIAKNSIAVGIPAQVKKYRI